MIRVRKATNDGIKYACSHFDICNPEHEYAYSVFDDSKWLGVVLFRHTDTRRYDKWAGQVFEMGVSIREMIDEAVKEVIKKFCQEVPCADLVVSRKMFPDFLYIGKVGEKKKCAFLVRNERLNAKFVKRNGWRASVLWLRENVDPSAEMYDPDAEDMFAMPLNKVMAKRIILMG